MARTCDFLLLGDIRFMRDWLDLYPTTLRLKEKKTFVCCGNQTRLSSEQVPQSRRLFHFIQASWAFRATLIGFAPISNLIRLTLSDRLSSCSGWISTNVSGERIAIQGFDPTKSSNIQFQMKPQTLQFQVDPSKLTVLQELPEVGKVKKIVGTCHWIVTKPLKFLDLQFWSTYQA